MVWLAGISFICWIISVFRIVAWSLSGKRHLPYENKLEIYVVISSALLVLSCVLLLAS